MSGRIFSTQENVSSSGETSLQIVFKSEIHEIHLWRVTPGDWIYPHIHLNNDDIWYIIQGEGEYYYSSLNTKSVKPGDVAVARPEDVHGMFNSGTKDIIVYSVLSPLPVEIEPAPDFEYPE